jgi:dipeptidyl aminopeptidase/acylaminoacyl peptidase
MLTAISPGFHYLARTLFCIGALALSIFTNTGNAESLDLLPIKAFYEGAQLHNVRLSPDGTHLLALRNIDGTTAIMVLNIETGERFYPTTTDNEQYKFNWVSWANNDRLLMSLRFDAKRGPYARIKTTETRLLAIDAKKSSKMINLVKPDSNADGWVSQFQDNIISMLPDDPKHILVSVDREFPNRQTVYKANVYTGKLSRVKKYSSSVRSWIADRQGEVRAGEGYNDRDRSVSIRVLDPRTEKWVTAWEYIVFDEPSISIMGFGKDKTELYILADHEGRKAIFKADLAKDGYPRELILSDPYHDISGELIYSHVHKDVVGLYYSGSSDKSIFWNAEFKAFQGGLDKAMPDTVNYISSLSADMRKYIVFSSNATQPGTILFGDRDEKTLSYLADIYASLNEDVLIEKQELTYKARDGLELEGYLSLPKNYADKPIATIILPHGGPMSQDGKGFDSFSSFMVNRGYAVFQPNFRGSSGYGHDFMMMAVGGMGLAMQDDLEDAVKFLVDKKFTDRKRVCIVGGSYGGYAALMGATKTPDLFQCAISFAGISDINKLRNEARYFVNRNVIREQLGNDSKQLRATSPARLAKQVNIPILLIHGDDDTVVPVNQSRVMANALKKHDKIYEYIELEGGSHYLDYMPHRKQTFEAMESFLQKYLPTTI